MEEKGSERGFKQQMSFENLHWKIRMNIDGDGKFILNHDLNHL